MTQSTSNNYCSNTTNWFVLAIVFFLLLMWVTKLANAQKLNNFRSRIITIETDSILLDSLSIIPGTLQLFSNNSKIPLSAYTLKSDIAVLFIDSSIIGKQIKIEYRVFPINFSEKYFHKDYEKLSKSEDLKEGGYYYKSQSYSKSYYLGNDMIEKRGDISRGISFGNNQDVIVNSSLNLQLSGKLNNEFEIRAAITDDNIPIQPDGNSQQIQEFDKIFIQLFNAKTDIRVGDFELKSKNGTFLRVNKNTQGALFSYNTEKENHKFKTTVSAAVSKGKYNKMSFSGIEGNQGPYRLLGAENESYIIILAGSEKVYIDGKLLVRGQENDYTIDYNQAELSFTPNQLITKDKRIVIEFEYSDRNYTRFIFFNRNEFISEKSNFYINFFIEQDSKNQPLQHYLSNPQKQLLANIGDSLNQALIPNIDSVGYTNDRILYKKTDSINNGNLYSPVYIFSTNPDSARFTLGFSFVGEGKGNYMPAETNANGKAYKWVAPTAAGNPLGDYEPVVLLVTPKKKQVLTLGGSYDISKSVKSAFEIAITNNDINTFSSLNANDDIGFAINLNLLKELYKDKNYKNGNIGLHYQLVNRNFNPVDNFRDIEYNYNWNLENETTNTDEHIIEFFIDLKNDSVGKASFTSEYMNRVGRVSEHSQYQAYKNSFSTNLKKGSYSFMLKSSFLSTYDEINRTGFFRNNVELKKELKDIGFGKVLIKVSNENENNKWRAVSNDSLTLNSFAFNQTSFVVSNADTLDNLFQLAYISRSDYFPNNSNLEFTTISKDLRFSYRFLSKKRQSVKTVINYRKLEIRDTSLTTQPAENTVNSRIEMNFRWFKGAITSSTFYEIGSGLEQKKEYSFIQVSPGQGIYIWNDYNTDNVKQIDEFELSSYQDTANYIRIFIPGNEYEKILLNKFNQTLSLRPVRLWKKSTGFKKFVSRFSNRAIFRANRKNSPDNFWHNVNPFLISPSESNLKSINASIRNTLSFNKTNSHFGIDYLFQNNSNKLLLINGFDTRVISFQGLHIRWKINKKMSLNNNVHKGNKQFESDVFASKNYKIDYWFNNIMITLQNSVDWRMTVNYKISMKDNLLGAESSTENNFGLGLIYNIVTKGNLNASFNFIIIDYNVINTNTPIAYEMLTGLQPGQNFTWDLQFQTKLSDNLQMNLNYNGRKSENYPAVHTGGIQLRAYF